MSEGGWQLPFHQILELGCEGGVTVFQRNGGGGLGSKEIAQTAILDFFSVIHLTKFDEHQALFYHCRLL